MKSFTVIIKVALLLGLLIAMLPMFASLADVSVVSLYSALDNSTNTSGVGFDVLGSANFMFRIIGVVVLVLVMALIFVSLIDVTRAILKKF